MQSRLFPFFTVVAGIVGLCKPAFSDDLRGTMNASSNSAIKGWYLRADTGINMLGLDDLSQPDLTSNGGSFIAQSTTNTASIGFGAGYRFNDQLRIDGTWEVRTASNLDAVSNIQIMNARNQLAADIYTSYDAEVETQLALLNAYYDIGTWGRLTPFIGGSIGAARNTVKGVNGNNNASINFYDSNPPHSLVNTLTESSSIFAQPKTKTNLAWAVTAGLAYAANDNLTLEGSVRYADLGSTASTNIINCTCGATGQPLELGRLSSLDFRVGMRWALGEKSAVPAEPLVVHEPEYNPVYK